MLTTAVLRLSRSRFLWPYLRNPYIAVHEWIWNHIPISLTSLRPMIWYGKHCQALARLRAPRRMSIATMFLRNRPELECIRRLLEHKEKGAAVSLAVVACSKGAEVYTLSYAIRSARPDLNLTIHAVDISEEILQFARQGRYSLKSLGKLGWPDRSLIAEKGELVWQTWQGQNESIFERVTPAEMEAMFDRQGDEVSVKARFREGITWQNGDAADPQLAVRLGTHDMVMAKNFLCHLNPAEAEKCLRNIPRLVKPGGYLFVSGVDLEVRTKVASELRWTPHTDRIKEVHDGDPSLRTVWPWNYCGLEPFDPGRADWQIRYAGIFQMPASSGGEAP